MVGLKDADGGHYLIWSAVLQRADSAAAPAAEPAEQLAAARRLLAPRAAPVWVVVLCSGGHFAAAALQLHRPPRGARGPEARSPAPS